MADKRPHAKEKSLISGLGRVHALAIKAAGSIDPMMSMAFRAHGGTVASILYHRLSLLKHRVPSSIEVILQ